MPGVPHQRVVLALDGGFLSARVVELVGYDDLFPLIPVNGDIYFDETEEVASLLNGPLLSGWHGELLCLFVLVICLLVIIIMW